MNFLSTGEKIKRARIYKGMTLKELCKDNISISRMSCIENGKVIPEEWVLKIIAERLDLKMKYLLWDDICELKNNIEKYGDPDIELKESECEEIIENIEYAISKEYYDLGFKLIHIIFNYYLRTKKYDSIGSLFNDYYLLNEKNPDIQHIYYSDLAEYFILRENYKDAETYYNLLIEALKRENKKLSEDEIIKINLSKCICCLNTKKVEEFELVTRSLLDEILNNVTSKKISVVDGILALLNIINNKEYKKLIDRLDKNKNEYANFYSFIKLYISKVLLYRDKLDECEKNLKEAIEFSKNENAYKYLDTLLFAIKLLINLKRYSDASSYTEEALQLAIERNSIVHIAEGYYLKSIISKTQGSFIQWEMYMNLSTDLLLKFASFEEKRERYLEMANMYHIMGEIRESLKYLTLSSENKRTLF